MWARLHKLRGRARPGDDLGALGKGASVYPVSLAAFRA
jgi:hypothetical protein